MMQGLCQPAPAFRMIRAAQSPPLALGRPSHNPYRSGEACRRWDQRRRSMCSSRANLHLVPTARARIALDQGLTCSSPGPSAPYLSEVGLLEGVHMDQAEWPAGRLARVLRVWPSVSSMEPIKRSAPEEKSSNARARGVRTNRPSPALPRWADSRAITRGPPGEPPEAGGGRQARPVLRCSPRPPRAPRAARWARSADAPSTLAPPAAAAGTPPRRHLDVSAASVGRPTGCARCADLGPAGAVRLSAVSAGAAAGVQLRHRQEQKRALPHGIAVKVLRYLHAPSVVSEMVTYTICMYRCAAQMGAQLRCCGVNFCLEAGGEISSKG